MLKKENLKSFNLYQYLKEMRAHSMSVPFFLANEETYRDAEVRFPFRTFTFGIGLTYVSKGSNLFRIGGSEYEVRSNCLTTVGPGTVCQWIGDYSSSHDTIYFTEDLFGSVLKSTFVKSLPFFLPGANHVIQLTEQEAIKMQSLFTTIKQFSSDLEVVPGLTYSLLTLVEKFHGIREHRDRLSGAPGLKICSDFAILVAKHFAAEKEVSFYAEELHVTPKYLSQTLLEQTGKTAKAVINSHVSMEAKSLLRQTQMSIQEIAFYLGYEDPSYFVKAFKKWEGQSPSNYRKL